MRGLEAVAPRVANDEAAGVAPLVRVLVRETHNADGVATKQDQLAAVAVVPLSPHRYHRAAHGNAAAPSGHDATEGTLDRARHAALVGAGAAAVV